MGKSKKRAFNKKWKSLFTICAVLAVFLSYTLFVLLYHFIHMDQLAFVPSEVFQDFLKVWVVLSYMFSDPNLRVVTFTLPFLFFAYLLSLGYVKDKG